jgi:hypothetical protein
MAEHQFISSALDSVLARVSNVRLYGITEADRRTFDYACVLQRDLSRPLVSQVLWTNTGGIDKDLRTLLHDQAALLKIYFIRDSTAHRIKVEAVLSSYREHPTTQRLLRGLRIVFVPGDFDADKAEQREWMERYIEDIATRDLLFGIVFGRLTAFDFETFSNHGGPIGLKYAILHEVTEHGLIHTPTFKERLGYRTDSPIREALTMLSATGLIRQLPSSVLRVPTIKGRLLLDLTRRILFEAKQFDRWSDELALLLRQLGQKSPRFPDQVQDTREYITDPLLSTIYSARACATEWGRNLLEGLSTEPQFYSDFPWERFSDRFTGPQVLEDPESLFFFRSESSG